jgi:ribosomal protein S18 acetylase RimI-like enzyme
VENVTIRKAKASELGEIVKMHLSLQEHLENSSSSIWKYTEDMKRLLRQQYTEHLVNENSLLLVAEVEANVVGFLLATVSSRTEYLPSIVGTLSSIYIGRNYRRRGIGSRMIREACEFFSSKKAEHIYVRYVLGNEEGEGFWEHLGFKQILVTGGALSREIRRNLSML